MTTAITEILKTAEPRLKAWIPPDLAGPRYNERQFCLFAAAQLQALVQKTPSIRFHPPSVRLALATFAMAGLLPNAALGLGYLVPFRQGKRAERIITPIFGYRGMKALAMRSGQVLSITSKLIYSGDGLQRDLPVEAAVAQYIPPPDVCGSSKSYDRVEYAAAMAQCLSPQGVRYTVVELVPRGQLDAVQATSRAQGEDQPWAVWPGQMARKTAVRRLVSSRSIPVADVCGLAVAMETAVEHRDIASQRAAVENMAAIRGVSVADVAEVAADMEATSFQAAARPRGALPRSVRVGVCPNTGIRWTEAAWRSIEAVWEARWTHDNEEGAGGVVRGTDAGEIVTIQPPEMERFQEALREAFVWLLTNGEAA